MSKLTIEITQEPSHSKIRGFKHGPFVVIIKANEKTVRSQVCDSIDEVETWLSKVVFN